VKLVIGLAAAVLALAQPTVAIADTPKKDQPPAVKLKLGHYASERRGIGLVVDLTRTEARIRFDGTKDVLKLDRINQSSDSVDYGRNIHHTTLRVYKSGRVQVWVPGGSDEAIDVRRDGDADPL
jgi:hypothetical protein